MGCQPSKQIQDDIISIQTTSEFKLSHRELVCQDRGQIFDLYHFSSIVSRGNYSIIRKVTSRGSLQHRICKIIPLAYKDYFSVISEVEFLKKLDHPNIVQIIQYFLEPTVLYIILQEIPGNKILYELNKIKDGVNFTEIVEIMKQILSAMEYCNKKQIVHRALGPDNVLLIRTKDRLVVKIIDFSQATILDCPNPKPILKQKRSINFPNQQQLSSQFVDTFDCGFLFYCLLLGKKSIHISPKQVLPHCLELINKLQLPQQMSIDMKELLSDMLNLTPEKKIKFSQFLNYAFFKHFNNKVEPKTAISNMFQFHTDDNLKYLFCLYGSLNMTTAIQKSQFIMQFYNLDKNKDGVIQLQQMIQGIMNTFNTDRIKATKCAQKLFQNLNKNKNGYLNFSQFVTATMKLSKLLTDQFLQAMFNQMDLNKDGYISQAELNSLIAGINRHLLINRKQIDFSTFKNIMVKILKSKNSVSQKTILSQLLIVQQK